MIYVTQGHEQGIGLEVFFKSLRLLNQVNIDQLKLYADSHYINETLKTISNDFSIKKNNILFESKSLKYFPVEDRTYSSSKSLEAALRDIKQDEILFTLPTSKDQLLIAGEKQLGYTEYLRNHFHNRSLAMVFKNKKHISALLSDHIPLSKVSETLKYHYIKEKSLIILENCNSYLGPVDDIFFAGINPHAGESGLLGLEENELRQAIHQLAKDFPHLNIITEPIPADALHFHLNNQRSQIFIYAFHDQGLTAFKQRFGLFGANITLGLPFKRLSVDHGTAFPLFGKNVADSSGCLHCLKEALTWKKNEYK